MDPDTATSVQAMASTIADTTITVGGGSPSWARPPLRPARHGITQLAASCVFGIPKDQPLESELKEAIESYNSATEDVSTAFRAYSTCLADTEGKDDCSRIRLPQIGSGQLRIRLLKL